MWDILTSEAKLCDISFIQELGIIRCFGGVWYSTENRVEYLCACIRVRQAPLDYKIEGSILLNMLRYHGDW